MGPSSLVPKAITRMLRLNSTAFRSIFHPTPNRIITVPSRSFCTDNEEKLDEVDSSKFRRKETPVRGMHDMFPEEKKKFDYIQRVAAQTLELYGFEPTSTPVLENASVFQRTLGPLSDVVLKEMFTLSDLSGVIRSILSEKSLHPPPYKYYYQGPAFRYERPQKGRFRQFHQVGLEWIGVSDPQSDVEGIAVAWQLLHNLGLLPRVKLQMNSLGDFESREKYKKVLIDYFHSHVDRLSNDSKKRLERGSVLRILDSKEEYEQGLLIGAPSIHESLSQASQDRFGQVLHGLDILKIPYEVNPKLVRGLDYYTSTLFECSITDNSLGRQQGTLLGGGRYDTLVKGMGGPSLPGLGWAAGLERLLLTVSEDLFPSSPRPLGVVMMSSKENVTCGNLSDYASKITQQLRQANIPTRFEFHLSSQKQIRKLTKECVAGIFVGEEELQSNTFSIKYFDETKQEKWPLEKLLELSRGVYGEEKQKTDEKNKNKSKN